MTDWELPGYQVLDLLGFGACGEVWRARHLSSGSLVVLRRVAVDDPGRLAGLRAQATVVRSLPSAHLIRLRDTLQESGDTVLVLDHAAAGSLAALLARHGRVHPGEVVTALAPVAQALGEAHRHGLSHGRLTASSILLTADGRPLLEGLGLSCLYGAGDGDGAGGPAADDVRALGSIGHLMLTGGVAERQPGGVPLAELAPTAPLPLVRALAAALDPDPAARPSADDLGAALLSACPARALGGLQPATPSPARARLSESVHRALPALVSVLLVMAVAAGGWAWGRQAGSEVGSEVGSGVGSGVGPARAAGPVDWMLVLQRLDATRAQAFARSDPGLLAAVYPPGSALLAADRLAVARLAQQRRTAIGVRHEVRTVVPVAIGPDRVVLRVRESLSGVELRGAGVVRRPPGPVVERVVVLVRTGSGWRVSEVRTSGRFLQS